jgi:hypothetical protein
LFRSLENVYNRGGHENDEGDNDEIVVVIIIIIIVIIIIIIIGVVKITITTMKVMNKSNSTALLAARLQLDATLISHKIQHC